MKINTNGLTLAHRYAIVIGNKKKCSFGQTNTDNLTECVWKADYLSTITHHQTVGVYDNTSKKVIYSIDKHN